jgi:hypothetical protein
MKLYMKYRRSAHGNLQLPENINLQTHHETIYDLARLGKIIPWGVQAHMKALLNSTNSPIYHFQDFPLLESRLRTLYSYASAYPKFVVTRR